MADSKEPKRKGFTVFRSAAEEAKMKMMSRVGIRKAGT